MVIRKWFQWHENLCIITINDGLVTTVQIEEGRFSFFFGIEHERIVEFNLKDHNGTAARPLPEERKRVSALASQIFRGGFSERVAGVTIYKPDGSLSKFRERWKWR